MMVNEICEKKYNKPLSGCTNEEIYYALLDMTKDLAAKKESEAGKKKVYYISAEFLIGKLLSNNLINLGLYKTVKEELEAAGKDIGEIEEIEPEPSLGNGGLGRLAACFLDSMATLNLHGDGVGLNYHMGLFKQVFDHNFQKETPNPWIEKDSWLIKTNVSYPVSFGDLTVTSRMYDIEVTGYEGRTNKLHLFDVDTLDESLIKDGTISFDKTDIARNLTLFLYPDDSDEAGNLLRIYQQYFMVSNAAHLILDECTARGCKLTDLDEYAAIQINDTHPSMVIPELIRLLLERGITMDEAVELVTKVCAYTNHTILSEALEKWPLAYLEKVVPQLVLIIKELDKRAKAKYSDPKVAIIDENDRVHMAHMDIHYGHSVNGVAYLHTEILKNSELNAFYKIYPEKFNNKTNGITFRRWLLHCNRELAQYIESLIGPGFKKDADELEKLLKYKDNKKVLAKLEEIKHNRKLDLKQFLYETQNIALDENSIIDVQIKRLHEYKRQQMNALYAIYKYMDIKSGNKPKTPITMVFGAKAAPAYIIAKDIIHLILCLQELIDNDPEVSPYFKVIMLENYNVSKAAKVIPAADISEQISLASKEASGTGNMKFMLNGAPTLGTMDGANVEIVEEVGEENAFIFGLSSQEVIDFEHNGQYDPKEIYNMDSDIRAVLTQLVDGTYSRENPELFREIYNSLLESNGGERADQYFILKDFRSYAEAQKRVEEAYKDEDGWAKKAMLQTAKCGKFSSDRTIEEYAKEIWHLEKVVL